MSQFLADMNMIIIYIYIFKNVNIVCKYLLKYNMLLKKYDPYKTQFTLIYVFREVISKNICFNNKMYLKCIKMIKNSNFIKRI